MKTHPGLITRRLASVLVTAALLTIVAKAHGQIFVADDGNSRIGEYDAVTGAAINAGFVSGLSNGAQDLTISSGIMYVTNGSFSHGAVGEYNAATGAVVNASFITSVVVPTGIALSGNTLYIANFNSGTIALYNATTGALINNNFLGTAVSGPNSLAISGGNLFIAFYGGGNAGEVWVANATSGAHVWDGGLNLSGPTGLAVSGNIVYVADHTAGAIREYNATTGAAVNTSFITGLSSPYALAIAGGNLYITDQVLGTVGEYNAATGAAINPSLVTGLSSPRGIFVATVPEPSPSIALASMAVIGLAVARRRPGRASTR